MPDLRIDDVRTSIVAALAPLDHSNPRTERGTLVYLLEGDFTLEIEGSDRGPHRFAQGTAIGFEDGRAHRWRSLAPPGTQVALFISSIPLRLSVLRRLDERFMVIPADAEPFATTMRLAIELHRHEFLAAHADDDGVIRRCAEICLMQFVQYTREAIAALPIASPGLAHDEHMLRAWAAYFRDPRRRWTVALLAEAAGMGRTAFALRFREVFGTPPLQALTELRLDRALSLLCDTRAPLIEIAFTSGYNSEAAFVRAFHRRHGMPPGQYRHAHS